MGITVINPHNGEEMKVRDGDAGRAVKDREGRIFYVMPKKDGSGYYGALTRAGSDKEEARNKEMEDKVSGSQANKQTEWQSRPSGGGGGFFATIFKLIKLLIVLAVLAGLAWAVFFGPLKGKIPYLPGYNAGGTPPAATTKP
jgi:hypothetical protein